MSDIHLLYILIPLLITAVIWDIRKARIPNWLTFSSIILAIGYWTASNGLDGLLFSVGGVTTGLAALIFFYAMGGMGAGDVKLMGAVGGLLGPKWVFMAFILTGLAGGLYAIGLLAVKGKLLETAKRYFTICKAFIVTRKIIYIPPAGKAAELRLRYGLAIAIGTCCSVFMKNFKYIL
ncbi:MAG: prepilin peptidase [Nitrospiraceae bacterium]|nr:MAG: prepilin peptidase [Nitrospiraceae bacterium]